MITVREDAPTIMSELRRQPVSVFCDWAQSEAERGIMEKVVSNLADLQQLTGYRLAVRIEKLTPVSRTINEDHCSTELYSDSMKGF